MNKSKNKTNNQKGITLIALVITIVVLVILVGVTVSTTINSGLIVNSKKAVADYKKVQTQEETAITDVEVQMDLINLSSSSNSSDSSGSSDLSDSSNTNSSVLKVKHGFFTGMTTHFDVENPGTDCETVEELESRLPSNYTGILLDVNN